LCTSYCIDDEIDEKTFIFLLICGIIGMMVMPLFNENEILGAWSNFGRMITV